MTNKNKSKKKFSFRRLIYNDKYLILTSLILAVVIWIGASLNIGTDESKVIKITAAIELNDEVAEQLGMQYYTVNDTIELTITLSGAKYVVGQVTEDDLTVKFDTSNVTRTGVQSIPILVSNSGSNLDFDVDSVYPTSVECFYDVNSTKTLDISLSFDQDSTDEGYVFGTPVLSEDKVVISGPKSYVDNIEKAVINIDFGEEASLTEQISGDYSISLVGNNVDTTYISMHTKTDEESELSSVTVTIPVLKETVLPVEIEFENQPEEFDDSLIDVSYSVDEINAGVLDGTSITSAIIGQVDFSSLNVGKNEFSFNVNNLDGITVLDDISSIDVVITIDSSYSIYEIEISADDITVEGLADGEEYDIKSLSATTLTIISLDNDATFDVSDLSIKVDLKTINEENIYPVEVSLNTDTTSWVYHSLTAEIEIND